MKLLYPATALILFKLMLKDISTLNTIKIIITFYILKYLIIERYGV